MTAPETKAPRGRRRRALAWLAGAALLGLAGCETGDEYGHEDAAQAAAETFLESCARGAPEAAVLNLTVPARKRFIVAGEHLQGCVVIARFGLPGEERLTEEEIKALFDGAETVSTDVNGGFAEIVIAARGDLSTLEAELVRGRWLLTNPLPLES